MFRNRIRSEIKMKLLDSNFVENYEKSFNFFNSNKFTIP